VEAGGHGRECGGGWSDGAADAALNGNGEAVRVMVEHDADKEAKDAIVLGRRTTWRRLKVLVQLGVDKEAKRLKRMKQRPLHVLCTTDRAGGGDQGAGAAGRGVEETLGSIAVAYRSSA
jgi:hypothetical protein